MVALVTKGADASLATVLGRVDPGALMALAVKNADAMDLLFLGIAVYEGYRLSFAYRLRR